MTRTREDIRDQIVTGGKTVIGRENLGKVKGIEEGMLRVATYDIGIRSAQRDMTEILILPTTSIRSGLGMTVITDLWLIGTWADE